MSFAIRNDELATRQGLPLLIPITRERRESDLQQKFQAAGEIHARIGRVSVQSDD